MHVNLFKIIHPQREREYSAALREHQWASLVSLTRHGPYRNSLLIERSDGYWEISAKVPRRKYKSQGSLEEALKRATIKAIENWTP